MRKFSLRGGGDYIRLGIEELARMKISMLAANTGYFIVLSVFPALLLPHQPAGTILPDNDCGYLPGTPVFAGIGDAGATTLASGIVRPGQYNINLGTSGWVASVSEDILLKDAGVFHLAAAAAGQYISVVPFLNAGNVHNWACRTYAGGDYDRAEALTRSAAPGNASRSRGRSPANQSAAARNRLFSASGAIRQGRPSPPHSQSTLLKVSESKPESTSSAPPRSRSIMPGVLPCKNATCPNRFSRAA